MEIPALPEKPPAGPVRFTDQVMLQIRSCAGLFRVVRVADSVTEPAIQLRAVQDDFFEMHRFDSFDRDRELSGVLDVEYQFRPTAGRNLTHRAEFLATVRDKCLKSNFDFFLHDAISVFGW
jgi:hypothetical protein